MVGVIFLVFSLISAWGVRWLENHLAIGMAQDGAYRSAA